MSASNQTPNEDRRVLRSRIAAIAAAKTLFLKNGFIGTTMEDVAAEADLSKRTLYNIYTDKNTLFQEVIADVIIQVEQFAQDLDVEFKEMNANEVVVSLHDLGIRLAIAILRPEVIALRRLLVSESGTLPVLTDNYFKHAPGRVMVALAKGIVRLQNINALQGADPKRAAEQFAYLVAGANLDRAVLLGKVATRKEITEAATEGVKTFLARFGPE